MVHDENKLFHHQKVLIDPIIENKTLKGIIKIFIVVFRNLDTFYDSSDYLCEDVDYLLSEKNGVDYANTLVCYTPVKGKRFPKFS